MKQKIMEIPPFVIPTTNMNLNKLEMKRTNWNAKASIVAKNTFNPIRNILETIDITPNPQKKMISLSIGDPTVFGNLKPAKEVVEAVTASLLAGVNNGYGPSTGFLPAREAVAKHVSVPGGEVTAEDVILCSGCSCALDIAISTLAEDGQNILVPRPGFPLYTTLSAGLGIETREYNLLPENDWEVDLLHMESLIDENTAAIIVNSPSNPCGSVFTPAHLKQILAVAEMYKVPIIADEIYDNFVFPGQTYVPIASLTTTVPVLSCGGLTKRFLVPGWRMGWIVIYDKQNIFAQEIRKGLLCMSQRIIGSNTLIQGALPTILQNTPKSFFEETIHIIKSNADLAYKKLKEVPGLMPVMPQGAMYMMVKVDMSRFPMFRSDLDFVERLVSEQSVFCLPGKCFNYPNYFRIVLTVPQVLLSEACDRMLEYCSQHLVCPPPSRLVGLLVENRSLYATYGKKYGMFLDNPHSSNWHSTWQLAVTMADAMRNENNRKNSNAGELRKLSSTRNT
ncbi:tyrosine aminotransferase [Eurytemora carolleeae]|uniref:tyrosine aminotransferase n=1 Tax=Eurytemora carolleeae TaxID=1294199 RepID=UPI000C7597E3|nr:tyrosine aminotransferase [Eurytemora carolleeae]|eukprot:XP_023346899.1 tyrosine aminotransferase-like [Eurytemora affinis]